MSFQMAFLSLEGGIVGIFRYNIGIGFIDIVVQNLIVYKIDLISILYQIIPFKIIHFEENRVPVRSVLKILKKIALLGGIS